MLYWSAIKAILLSISSCTAPAKSIKYVLGTNSGKPPSSWTQGMWGRRVQKGKVAFCFCIAVVFYKQVMLIMRTFLKAFSAF